MEKISFLLVCASSSYARWFVPFCPAVKSLFCAPCTMLCHHRCPVMPPLIPVLGCTAYPFAMLCHHRWPVTLPSVRSSCVLLCHRQQPEMSLPATVRFLSLTLAAVAFFVLCRLPLLVLTSSSARFVLPISMLFSAGFVTITSALSIQLYWCWFFQHLCYCFFCTCLFVGAVAYFV